MIAFRPAATRGVTRRDDLERWHSFSSGHYYDPAHMGFGALRVLDSDQVGPAAACSSQRRANMEILTWLIAGKAQWSVASDSGSLEASSLDCLSAGSGIDHVISPVGDAGFRSVQLWLQPNRVNLAPRHAVQRLSSSSSDSLQLLASGYGEAGAWPLRSDARVKLGRLGDSETLQLDIAPSHRVWLQVLRGALDVGSTLAANGDGVAIIDELKVNLKARCDSEFLLIEVA